jgi:predicted Fe-Mo cluster-binding NifX family protein
MKKVKARWNDMRIAVTSKGKSPESEVDERFGRAKYFIIYDTGSERYNVLDNELNLNAAQGAGVQSGELVVREGANVLLTGHCGPKAFRVLSAAGVAVFNGCRGTVEQAIESFQNGEMQQAQTPDVRGHW